ncbi:YIP1 family protein [Aquimarina spongiae]|uniref:Yip1 domain-containing protein n=1 Tax=Aquimarina spongiae TaxID=570521 RepID=A0A1M6I0U8_9FLAO|nr:YIP1 family protein [Aquimarina spongiae]SHJ28116.1 Yip1 domain-containing protein [Aquimarina spongiae]
MKKQIDAFAQLLIDPKSFFKNDLETNDKNLFAIAMVVFCIGYGIDRMDRQLVKLDLRGTLDEFGFFNTWIGYWSISIIGGAIGGYILYLIGGWFYHVRVKWSKGKGDLDHSRRLYLFSNFYLYLSIALVSVCATLILSRPYDPYAEFSVFDGITGIVVILAIFYTIYISFSGVMSTTEAERTRAVIWFIVLPAFFYIVSFSALIALLAFEWF